MSADPIVRRPRLRAVTRSLHGLYRGTLILDRTQSDPVVALRNALGLVIPLVIATIVGHPVSGVAAAIGALQTAFADRPGPYRLRLARMTVTAFVAGITAGLAAGFGSDTFVSAIILACCAFAAGGLVVLGPSAAQVGIAATGCALVLGHLPATPLAALWTGVLVFAGGLGQTVLAISAWPLRRHGPERRVLAALYGELAQLADEPVSSEDSPPLGPIIAETRAVLLGAGSDHGPSVEAYRVLLDQAVRARRDVLVLETVAERLSEQQQAGAAGVIMTALHSAAGVLRLIATSLMSAREVDPSEYAHALALVAGVEKAGAALGESLSENAAAERLASLGSQLRAILATSRTGAAEGRRDEDTDRIAGSVRLRDPLAVLRANMDLRSPALRYALRLAILVPSAEIVVRAAGVQRGYWVSLTILVVLRPDFGATFQRSLLRVTGTLIGLVLASLFVHYALDDGTLAAVIVIGVLFFGMRLAGPNNMGLASVCLSALVVVLLSLAGQPAHATVVARAIATVIGGVVALAASLFFPSWERGQVTDRLVELLSTYRGYLLVICDSTASGDQRSAARASARLARSAAQASLDRARAEPVDAGAVVERGSAVLANTHRMAHALTAIDATHRGGQMYDQIPSFAAFVDACAEKIKLLQRGLRGGPIGESMLLRRKQLDVAAAITAAHPGGEAALIEASDRLVDSLETLSAALRSDSADQDVQSTEST